MIIHKLKSEIKIILLSLLIGVIATTFYTLKTYSNQTFSSISNKIVRFRVLPNSNSNYDQALKLIVKDCIINYLDNDLNNFSSNEEALHHLNNKLNEIESYANKIVRSCGYNYNVTAKIQLSTFPTRSYSNISLPNGQYTTLVIEIGDATGDNWWCVMYPPLCFVDETMEIIPQTLDDELQNTLSNNEYNIVTNTTFEYNVKFKIVELFN